MLRLLTFGGLSVVSADREGADAARAVGGALAQPRRLALLAVLARAGERGVSRERLLALFWPDDDPDRARRALAQAVYALRRELGGEAGLPGTHELRLDGGRVASDVADFTAHARAGRLDEAAALYGGPFLAGFQLAGTRAFDRWADEERAALAREHARLLERLAVEAERAGDAAGAAERWRALAAHDPLDARVAVRLMTALEARGDRAGALRHARVYEALVAQELELPPDREVVDLAERLRRAAPTPAPTTALATAPAAPTPGTPATERSEAVATSSRAADDGPARRPSWRSRRGVLTGALTAGVLGVVTAGAVRGGRASSAPTAGAAPAATPAAAAPAAPAAPAVPAVAVGLIADFRGERGGAARPLADMLATNLARAEGVRVVSPARVHELLRQLGGSDTAAEGFIAAARQAGAGELIDGTLYVRPGGALRLDLRRVDVASGAVRAALTLEGRDLFALADSGTARLLAGLGRAGVAGSVADVTTRSEAAYRDYDAGLRLYVAGEADSARARFDRALRQDSAFAMAAYYRAMSLEDRADRAAGLTTAVRLAERAGERERLLIRARWANFMAVGVGRAVADSLVARYPAEVEGYLLAGLARVDAGEHAAARPLLERAVVMDSLSPRAAVSGRPCAACVALRELAFSHSALGAGAEAERVARRWVRLQPRGTAAWVTLGDVLSANGRHDEARAAVDSAVALDPRGAGAYQLAPLVRVELRRGRLDEAERLARGRVGVGTLAERGAAYWMLNHTLRHQGRAREAVEVARAYRLVRDSLAGGVAYSAEAYMLGASLALAGRARESAAVFDSTARGLMRAGEDAASLARVRPLALGELAWARYLAGDTASLGRLADSVEALGAAHAWGHVRLLHHHVRGLQWAARGDRARALAAWQAAGAAPTPDHGGLKVLTGRALAEAGRPAEAVAVLRLALRGRLDATGGVPYAEVHEALGAAWARVPGPAARDSAAAHWRFVADAWRRGDPPYAARAAAARARLAAAGGPRPGAWRVLGGRR